MVHASEDEFDEEYDMEINNDTEGEGQANAPEPVEQMVEQSTVNTQLASIAINIEKQEYHLLATNLHLEAYSEG